MNRPHARRPRPNWPDVHGPVRERRPRGWRHCGETCPPTTMTTNTAEHQTLQLRTGPANVHKLYYTTLGQTKTQLPSTDTNVRVHGQDLTIRPPAAARRNPHKPSRPWGGRDSRAPITPQLQPPHDRKQTTRKPANTKPARRARVATGTASNGMAAPWCATPAGDHAHGHDRTPRLYYYGRGQPALTNRTTPHLDQPRPN